MESGVSKETKKCLLCGKVHTNNNAWCSPACCKEYRAGIREKEPVQDEGPMYAANLDHNPLERIDDIMKKMGEQTPGNPLVMDWGLLKAEYNMLKRRDFENFAIIERTKALLNDILEWATTSPDTNFERFAGKIVPDCDSILKLINSDKK